MEIYILQLLIIVLLSIALRPTRGTTNKKIYCVIIFLILAFIAGARDYTVGYDTLQYRIAYLKSASLDFSTYSQLRYEYGFTFLCNMLNKITNHWQILLIVTSLFINYSIIRFIYKNSKNPTLSIIIYIFMNFYFFYTSAMRQAIAVSIVLLGYERLKDNSYFKYIIYVLIACLFHESALLALLFIPLKKFKYNKNFIYLIIITFIIAFLFGKDFFLFLGKFSPRLLEYSEGKFFVENYFGALIEFVISVFLFIIGFIIMMQNKREILYDKKEDMNICIGILAIANLFLVLTMKVSIFNRFSPFFTIFNIIWIPNMLTHVKKPKNRLLLIVIIITILLTYWLIVCIFRPEWYGMIPYKFFW